MLRGICQSKNYKALLGESSVLVHQCRESLSLWLIFMPCTDFKKSSGIKPAFEAALLRLYLNVICFNYYVFKIPMLIHNLQRLIMCVG